MKIRCIWEHNGNDSLLYADNFVGAFTRGESQEIAVRKMEQEVEAYLRWKGDAAREPLEVEIVQEKASALNISDADSDVLFETEKEELSLAEYMCLRDLALKSAADFLALYEAVPDKDRSCLSARKTFYGKVPCTAYEMYEHTKNVNAYYFGEIGVGADNSDTILECRKRGFEQLESQPDFLKNTVCEGSYGEEWTLRKLLRRFIWHDRIHARAMYRMAVKTFGKGSIPDVYQFDCELLHSLDKLHTTELGVKRIQRNLSLETDDIVKWCKLKMESPDASIDRRGKNWYIKVDGCIITVNAHSYTIITAHKEKINGCNQIN